jgi:hypothetical protein
MADADTKRVEAEQVVLARTLKNGGKGDRAENIPIPDGWERISADEVDAGDTADE